MFSLTFVTNYLGRASSTSQGSNEITYLLGQLLSVYTIAAQFHKMGNKNSKSRGIGADELFPSKCQSIPAITVGQPPPYGSLNGAPQMPKPPPETDSRYAFLKEFDTIFLVDDSSNMMGALWQEAKLDIVAIASICTQYDNDGVDIFFLNHHCQPLPGTSYYSNVTSADAVNKTFDTVVPSGCTLVGKRLHDILGPYLSRLRNAQAGHGDDGTLHCLKHYVKPINVIVITDGMFTDDVESIIADFAESLSKLSRDTLPWQVGIQFFQIGNDPAAKQELERLDNDLDRDRSLRDIVDTIPWRGAEGQSLNADGILKCVLGAVNKKLDRG